MKISFRKLYMSSDDTVWAFAFWKSFTGVMFYKSICFLLNFENFERRTSYYVPYRMSYRQERFRWKHRSMGIKGIQCSIKNLHMLIGTCMHMWYVMWERSVRKICQPFSNGYPVTLFDWTLVEYRPNAQSAVMYRSSHK